MFRLRHRAVQGYLLRRGECRGAARSGGGRHTRARICGLQALYDARGHRGRRAAGLHGHRRRRRPDHAAGRRRGMRLHLLGERHHALRHRKGVAGGQDRLPQTDLMPPLSDPRRAVFERHGRAQLPPLVGLRPGARMRPQAGNPGLQGVARTDRAPFRRGILQGAGSRRRIYPTTIKYT